MTVDKVVVVVTGGIIAFGFFLLAAIVAVLVDGDADAAESRPHLYPRITEWHVDGLETVANGEFEEGVCPSWHGIHLPSR